MSTFIVVVEQSGVEGHWEEMWCKYSVCNSCMVGLGIVRGWMLASSMIWRVNNKTNNCVCANICPEGAKGCWRYEGSSSRIFKKTQNKKAQEIKTQRITAKRPTSLQTQLQWPPGLRGVNGWRGKNFVEVGKIVPCMDDWRKGIKKQIANYPKLKC